MPLDNTFATDRPTVPKPTMATFNGAGCSPCPEAVHVAV
jgi:hypothetical protein